MVHISAAGDRWTPMLLSAHHKGLRSKAACISCGHAARSSMGLRVAPVCIGRRGSQLFATCVLSWAVCRASSLGSPLRIRRRHVELTQTLWSCVAVPSRGPTDAALYSTALLL